MNSQLIQQGRAAYRAGDFSAAAQMLGAAKTPNEIMGEADHLRGNALMHLGMYVEAAEAYAAALNDGAYGKRGALLTNRGKALAAVGDYVTAAQAFSAATQDASYATPFKAYLGLGNALFQSGDFANAGTAFRQAAIDGANPAPAAALGELGRCFIKLGRPADAVETYRTAIDFAGPRDDTRALNAGMGEALSAAGRPSEALDAFNAATADGIYQLTPEQADELARVHDSLAALSAQTAMATAPAPAMDTTAVDSLYHKHKRRIPKPLIVIVLLAAVCGGAYWFVTSDPMGVMPGFYDQFGQAAKTTFPSRQKGEATEEETKSDDTAEVVQEETVLSDDQLYTKLDGLYQTIVSYGDDDQIGEVVDSFNSGYLRTPLSTRQELSQSAYALRDQIKNTQDELNNLKVQDDTVYAEDIEHLKQLAEWMYERVDMICQSWDISLSIPDGESLSARQSEILAPIAQGGNSALNQYDANVSAWRPQQRS